MTDEAVYMVKAGALQKKNLLHLFVKSREHSIDIDKIRNMAGYKQLFIAINIVEIASLGLKFEITGLVISNFILKARENCID